MCPISELNPLTSQQRDIGGNNQLINFLNAVKLHLLLMYLTIALFKCVFNPFSPRMI
jgi:hypothetical protein